MRTVLKTLLILLFVAQSPAEVFIGPTTSSNRLIVATGEGIIITELLVANGDNFLPKLVAGGVTNNITLDTFNEGGQDPYALKGGCELVINTASLLRFQRVPGDSLHTEIVNSGSTFQLSIPSGKTAKFFRSNADSIGSLSISNYSGGIINNVSSVYPEFDGPLWIKIQNTEANRLIVTYYLIDTALAQPVFGYIAVPPGTAEIAVEKSVDLTNWVTSITKVVDSDSAAYFRLRIRK